MSTDTDLDARTGLVEDAPRPAATATAAPAAPPARPASAPEPTTPSRPDPSSGTGRAAGKPGGNTWIVPLLVLVAGMFMSVLDISIVNVAITTMQNDFGATTDQMQWVSTAYSLCEGVVVPASAWLGIRYGLGRVYTIAMVFFAIFSTLCGFAWDINSIVAFRILQAIPGGVIPVVALAALYKIVPKDKLGAAMGIYGLGIIFAPAIGPTLGGYLVEYVNWRLIFFINVPIGVVGVLAAIFFLPTFSRTAGKKLDVPGFLAVAVGLFSMLLALHEGPTWGWTSYPTLILLTVGVLALALFVVIELEVDEPLLDLRVFAHWPFTNSLLLIAIISMGLFGVLFYIPVFLQQYQGLGAFETGLLLLPQALVMAFVMPAAGFIYDKIGARIPAALGLAIVSWTTWELAGMTIDVSHGHLEMLLAARAAGIGLAMMPIMTGGLGSLPSFLSENGSAVNTLVQRASSAIGLAAMTAMMTIQQAQASADRTGTASMPDGSSGMMMEYQMYSRLQSLSFVTAMNDLLYVTAILTALGVPLALMLRHGKPTPSDGPAMAH
ncbi:MDR family MFS transporter [Actinomycetospora sp. NBRC 106378]|uniref:MDR family MFS transporter n=1 Tax=Actinomycetospora sp. NBRC 106378 TaxID=3032208 RepID=UPI0024A0CDA2|nr:MDR family MFS transporter [Actinomycetospora sp. NBRC 106378]GLZ51514.1 MFS transporter [Actinomycetospora sp. NBRC 106378]